MNLRVGVDLLYVPRMKTVLQKDRYLRGLFHPAERAYCDQFRAHRRAQAYAARFCAKEAFMKALRRRVGWQDVWVEMHGGAPVLRVSEHVRARFRIRSADLSLTHDAEYAMACVILWLDDEP